MTSLETVNALFGPLFSALTYTLGTAIFLYIGVSIVLFIIDAAKAKKQGRKIKTGIKVMFIIAMVIEAIVIALGNYVVLLLIYFFVHGPF